MHDEISRRAFLARATQGAAFLASRPLIPASTLLTTAAGCPAPLGRPLPIPPLDTGTIDDSGVRSFELVMQPGVSELLDGVLTETLGYNGALLGPTLRMRQGERVQIGVTNQIGEVTTTHWHGMHVPARMDGGPHQTIAPDARWQADYEVKNQAATLWYHPHTHEKTGEQVYRGLAGLILIDDDNSDTLELPSAYGIDDIPLVIQDRRLGADGALVYMESMADRFGMKGDRILVNGALTPHLEAEATLVRLRILNGSNARIYNLGFDDDRSFMVIATDGGFLPAPVEVNRQLLAPGERVELLVDLSDLGDAVVRLLSFSSEVSAALFDGGGMGGMGPDSLDNTDFLIMTVGASAASRGDVDVPSTLNRIEALMPGAIERRFTLEMSRGQMTINGRAMDMTRIDERVTLDAVEVWEVVNNQAMAHPFHIHDVFFLVQSRDGQAPPAYEQGWKDTVLVQPGESVRFVARFDDFRDEENPYMFHCHILEHEDNAMMGQFVVV